MLQILAGVPSSGKIQQTKQFFKSNFEFSVERSKPMFGMEASESYQYRQHRTESDLHASTAVTAPCRRLMQQLAASALSGPFRNVKILK